VRITRDDHRQLVIVDFPWLIGVFGFGTAAFLLVATMIAIAHGRTVKNFIGPLLGVVLGFGCGAAFTKRSEFVFDFISKQLTWRRRGLFTNTGGVVPLAQIREAVVETNHNNGDGGPTHRVVLKTDAGPVPLTDASSSGEEKHNRIRDRINAALNVTPTPAGQQVESQILDLALAGKKIDAIKLARERYGYGLAEAKAFVEGLSNAQ
jgi:hypothetical protein